MDYARTAAFGVAGNFTGHLEQAGEAKDFVGVKAAAGKPKGLFPVYLAGDDRLGTWPFSADTLQLPQRDADVQPEPEVGLVCTVTYDEGGLVSIRPTGFAAADDTSIRRPPEPKISRKKNWGPNSKGLGPLLPLTRFDGEGELAHCRLASFLIRDGLCQAYGEDSAVRDYSTHYGELIAWMIDKFRTQKDVGPLECLAERLDTAGRPETLVITIGATRYLPHGEGNYLRGGDRVVIVVYDERTYDSKAVARAIAGGAPLPGASVLDRVVLA